MSALQHQLHAAHVERLARFAAAVRRLPQLPSPAQPPPIEEEPLMPQPPPPVAEIISIEDTPRPPSWLRADDGIPRTHPPIKDIQRIVAWYYKVDYTDILSQRRANYIVRPRQIAMYLAKMLTKRSLPEIGRRFGGKDHTTVLYAVRKIEQLAGHDGKLLDDIAILMGMLKPTAVTEMSVGSVA